MLEEHLSPSLKREMSNGNKMLKSFEQTEYLVNFLRYQFEFPKIKKKYFCCRSFLYKIKEIIRRQSRACSRYQLKQENLIFCNKQKGYTQNLDQ